MIEQSPSKEKAEKAEVSLEKTVFNELDKAAERMDGQSVREYGDLLRMLKEGAFRYTNYFLENLISQENLKDITGTGELRGDQEEVARSDASRHYSDETLPINFRVVGRFLSRHDVPVAWFDKKRDDLVGLKERNMLKIFSVRYALGSALEYEKLSKKDRNTKEEALVLGKIISSVESVEEIKNLVRKFNDLPVEQQKELLRGLNL